MSAKNLDRHNRWRSKTVAFRVSPEEWEHFEKIVALSGLTKQDYLIERTLQRDIIVQGNPRVYKALKNQMQDIYGELRRISNGGAVEEFVFRGLIYTKAKQIIQKDWFAAVISSVLFGIFHILRGDAVQMIMTVLMGALFCLFRLKIKRCSTLSLIIAHGVYDALITVWVSLLL